MRFEVEKACGFPLLRNYTMVHRLKDPQDGGLGMIAERANRANAGRIGTKTRSAIKPSRSESNEGQEVRREWVVLSAWKASLAHPRVELPQLTPARVTQIFWLRRRANDSPRETGVFGAGLGRAGKLTFKRTSQQHDMA